MSFHVALNDGSPSLSHNLHQPCVRFRWNLDGHPRVCNSCKIVDKLSDVVVCEQLQRLFVHKSEVTYGAGLFANHALHTSHKDNHYVPLICV